MLPLDLSDPDRPRPGEPRPFLRTRFNEERATLSPDGRWVAYTSDERGTNEVYVQSFLPSPSARGGRWQIPTAGGTTANWSRNGRELFYQTDNRIMVAGVHDSGRLVRGRQAPRVVTDAAAGVGLYQLRRVAGRAAVATFPRPAGDASAAAPRVAFLLDFFDEVRRRAPAR